MHPVIMIIRVAAAHRHRDERTHYLPDSEQRQPVSGDSADDPYELRNVDGPSRLE